MTLSAQDIVERLRKAVDGVTPGPWQVLSQEHPWTLPANPGLERPEEKHGNHTERRVYTVAHHPQLKGPYPIIEIGIGITNESGQSVHMVSISAENAAYIALCSPDNIGALLDTISRLTADNEVLLKERDEARAAHHRTSHKAVKRLRALWREKQAAEARADALAQEVERLKAEIETYRTAFDGIGPSSRLTALETEVGRLREALTPSADTKAAYSGEFYERIEVQNPNFDEDSEDDEPETIVHPFLISWTTTKKIMAAIRARAALTNEEAGR
jgi:hypothetical protein